MDRDSIILKYEQGEVQSAKEILEETQRKNHQQADRLDILQEKIKKAYEIKGRKPCSYIPDSVVTDSTLETPILIAETLGYDEIFTVAKESLESRGLDVDNIDYHDLVSEQELEAIYADLNRPLSRREKWTKSDFVVVFIAASIGSLADIILSDRNNGLTGTGSNFSNWLNQFHVHDGGGPIDYQGPGFGGGFHRGLSKGHDILRFIEGILMFKNGEFVGMRYVNGEAIRVVSQVNQYGNPYAQLTIIEAILKYAQHMFADLFSTCSLPFPGSSFLVESNDRQLRKFAADMYRNGFNCKNIIIQSVSTIIIEVIVRIYFSIQSVQRYDEDFELESGYSNYEAVKRLFKIENKDKLNELLFVAHAITTGVNMGKVIIKKSPWEINITEILSVVKYGVQVMKCNLERNSEYAKLIRNANEVHEKWIQLEAGICCDEKSIISEKNMILVV